MNKFVVGGIVLALVTCGWGTISVGEQLPAPQGELRIVDKDPMNWAWITWNVFEHLVEIDKDGKLVPRLPRLLPILCYNARYRASCTRGGDPACPERPR